MTALMGRMTWYGNGCSCCGGGRAKSQIRAAERRDWLADWADDLRHAEAERYDFEALRPLLRSLPADLKPEPLWRHHASR